MGHYQPILRYLTCGVDKLRYERGPRGTWYGSDTGLNFWMNLRLLTTSVPTYGASFHGRVDIWTTGSCILRVNLDGALPLFSSHAITYSCTASQLSDSFAVLSGWILAFRYSPEVSKGIFHTLSLLTYSAAWHPS